MAEGSSLSAAERIAASYKRLVSSSTALNQVSDEFSKPVEEIERFLVRLNLGVEAWQRFRGEDEDGTGSYWGEYIGFARVNKRWRIALNKVEGNHNQAEPELDETWPFSEAPRSLRIGAVDSLPDLVEKLIQLAEKTARKMEAKVADSRALASAVSTAAAEVAPKKFKLKRS